MNFSRIEYLNVSQIFRFSKIRPVESLLFIVKQKALLKFDDFPCVFLPKRSKDTTQLLYE